MSPSPILAPSSVRARRIAAALVLFLSFNSLPASWAQEPAEPVLDLEDLMNVQVTSLARKEQTLGEVPAALHVVRGEDARRMGATSLAESLRSVPGMQVARTRSNVWAISARGFNDNLSNKLLVLMDGRSVYSPLHSGVFWDVQDTFLEDVDRIEIIRGPGGSLWGANAINGVVNVISKSADQTQGVAVTGGGGTEERAFGGVRYGFQAGEDHFVRVFAKAFARDDAADGVDPDENARDSWHQGRAGFRSDLKTAAESRLTMTGDFYGGEEKTRAALPTLGPPAGTVVEDDILKARGGHLLARWETGIDSDSGMVFQLSYDHTFRHDNTFEDAVHTGDFDFQHRFRPLDGHDTQWGVGYRIYRCEVDNTFPFQIDPEDRTDDVVSAFVQDEIDLVPDTLSLTLGSKFEYNDYSGYEYQPSARLAWKPMERCLVWASVSRAVRTPSIIDESGRLTPIVAPGPIAFTIFGDPDFRSEVLIAYEAGLRLAPVPEVAADLAVFFNDYERLRSGEPGAVFLETSPSPHFVVPITLGNELDGEGRGVEASLTVQATSACVVRASYAWLRLHLSEEPAEGRDPKHTAWTRVSYDIGSGWAVDLMGRYVSSLRTFDVDKYIEADLRVAWRDPERGIEVSLVGQSLLRDSHEEFQAETQRSEIERGVYLSVRGDL